MVEESGSLLILVNHDLLEVFQFSQSMLTQNYKMSWFDKLEIDFIHGSLLDADTEAIACNVNVAIDLNYSIGKQLLEYFGPNLRGVIKNVRDTLPGRKLELGQAVWLDAPCPTSLKGIIFFGWWSSQNEFTANLIYTSFVNSLRVAFSYGCCSISFPLYGSGSGGMPFQLFQDTILQAFQELDNLRNSNMFSVEEVCFISTNMPRLEQLENHLARLSC